MTATLTLKRLFAAPPERVYAAWTDPARFAQWIGPVGVPCDVLAMSPIQGGAYHLVMRSSTGGTIQITGQFTRLSPHDRIEFTWNADWGQAPGGRKGGLASTITIRLRPAGEETGH